MPDTDFGKGIARNLKRILYDRRVSPADLSRDLGIKQTTISGWFNEYKVPRGKTIDALCEYLHCTKEELVGTQSPDSSIKSVKIKVYGRVAAGLPMEMIEDIYDEEEIPVDWTRGGKEYFGLVIHGDSMLPRMSEGDIVIVRKQPDAETGDTVIVTVNGFAATCKKLRKTPQGFELHPTNPAHEIQSFTHKEIAELPVVILGKVVELRAKY